MNWAGGFTDLNAAMTFASQGGIPIVSMVSGGQVTAVRIEHIWVEAAIDFNPARGAINKAADSWVSLDGSFKQYEDLKGLDVVAISGIDPTATAQAFAQSGTINAAEGWVQNLNPTVLQNAQTQAQTALQTHIAGMSNPTVGDVIGGRRIVTQAARVLPTGLPYRAIAIGARYGKLPASLQHRLTFAFGLDPIREPINPVTLPWSKLNNHKVTLSFKPSTATDEETLASLLPATVTDEAQLPTSIPAYLIYVTPELSIDGQVVGRGSAMRLGETLDFNYAVRRAGGIDEPYTYAVVAGSYLNIPVMSGSVSPLVTTSLAANLDALRDTFLSKDSAAIGALTQEQILGDIFLAGSLTYFGQYIARSQALGTSQRAQHNLALGYGSYGYEPHVRTLFGLPRAIEQGGIGLNIRLAWITQPLSGDQDQWRQLNLASGMLASALEHALPEFFSTSDDSSNAISAVKALSIANATGQQIYRLTPANQFSALPNIRLDGLSMSEIRAALASGKNVITHTDPVAIPGWQGAGYVILDPTTNGGAYKITGGKNGGYQQMLDSFVFAAAAALGYVDGKVGQHADKSYIISDRLKYLSKLAKASRVLGVLALLVSIYTILTDSGLSVSQKIGQIVIEAVGFGISVYITAAAVSLGFVPIFVGVLVALTMAVSIALIKAMYLSFIRHRASLVFV